MTQPNHTIQLNWSVTFPKGFRAVGLFTGIKKTKKDFALVVSDTPCPAAGVFTTNTARAAPVLLSQHALPYGHGTAQAVAIVSGVANACTGLAGMEAEKEKIAIIARELGISPALVLTASTGIIGKLLPVEKLQSGLSGIKAKLSDSKEAGLDAAKAILTTDLTEKTFALECDGFRVAGMAKGSGMIHPNMATMLAVITTDAIVTQTQLASSLKSACNQSFNVISVDGDTSTNDSVFVLANGASGIKPSELEFQAALNRVCLELAKQIVADGEGATKTFSVHVTGAASDADAARFARAVTTSSLVKTAIHGNDLNWGRVLSAMGATERPFDLQKTTLAFGPVHVFTQGTPRVWTPEDAQKAFAGKHVKITVTLNEGSGSAVAFGCDLSAEYVRINAAYST